MFDWKSFFLCLGVVSEQACPLAPEDERLRTPGAARLHGSLPSDLPYVQLRVHGSHDASAHVACASRSGSFRPPHFSNVTYYVPRSKDDVTSDPAPPKSRSLPAIHAGVSVRNVFSLLLQLTGQIYVFQILCAFTWNEQIYTFSANLSIKYLECKSICFCR